MADLQEIIKTHTKSYPSYLDTYPRNGKTTVDYKGANGIIPLKTKNQENSTLFDLKNGHNFSLS